MMLINKEKLKQKFGISNEGSSSSKIRNTLLGYIKNLESLHLRWKQNLECKSCIFKSKF